MKEKEELRLKELKQIEEELYNSGVNLICGIDEAGRGPLAGPVVVAAAIMPRNSMIEGVNDSKKVSEKKREKLYDLITDEAIAYGVGIIDQKEIVSDLLNTGFANDINVYIGNENENEKLKDFSIVTFKHRYKNKDIGTIGIIGPTRMNYSKVISVMKYISKKLNGE